MQQLERQEPIQRPAHLNALDWEELTGIQEGQSAIDPWIASACFQSVTDPAFLVQALNLGKGSREDIQKAELMLPGWLVRGIDHNTGEISFAGAQYKYRNPPPKLDAQGKPKPGSFQKYRSATDLASYPLFLEHPDELFWETVRKRVKRWLWITEGAKKSASLLSGNAAAIALPGVWNGQFRGRLSKEIKAYLQVGRNVCIVFDRDWIGNQSVARALDTLGRLIESANGSGAICWVATPPEGCKGVDDYIAKTLREGGTRKQAILWLKDNALTFKEWRTEYLAKDSSAQPVLAEGDHLPHAVNLELELLRAITSLNLPLPQLTQEDFYLGAHRAWWNVLVELDRQKTVIDYATVTQKLVDSGKLSEITEALGSDWAQDAQALSLDDYAAILREKTLRRKAIAEVSKIQLILKDEAHNTLPEAADRLQSLGYELATGQTADSLKTFGDLCAEVQADLLAKVDGSVPDDLFVPSHAPMIDRKIGGWERGGLIITGGRPGSGKTTFAVFHALASAIQGNPALIFSLEMSAHQLIYRALSAVTGIAYKRLQRGTVTNFELEIIFGQIGKLAEIPLWIDASLRPSVSEISAKVAKINSLTNGALGIVVLDYLGLMPLDPRQNKATALGNVVTEFKAIAKEYRVVFNCLCQLSRAVESRANKRPTMSDLRDSGEIEQAADLVLMLYRDQYYNRNSPMGNIGELLVEKNRSGEPGMIPICFDLRYYRALDPFWMSPHSGMRSIQSLIQESKTEGGSDWTPAD